MLILSLLAVGCDEAKQAETDSSASLQAQATIAAKDFELATVVALVEREDVRDAESLEALINAEDSTINVDVDADGTRDFVQVREVADARISAGAKLEAKAEADGALQIAGEDGEKVTFELRVVPSSKIVVDTEVVAEAEVETVVIATVDVELEAAEKQVVVEARYAPTVIVVAEADVEVEYVYVHHVEIEHRHDHWVVVGSPFVAWVWIDARPIYYGHYHMPPGHAKKLGLYWHGDYGGHWEHHGHYGHGNGHGNGHWKGHGGHHDVHHGGGGPDKVQIKVKGSGGGGGGGKVQVKGGGGGGGGGKAKGGKGKH